MLLHRAYSFLNVKDISDERRIITGTATTPTPDRMGDVVEPLGVSFKNPLPLLLYHNSQKPVGWVKFQKPTEDGITFEAKLPTVDEPGTVRDRIEEAWTSIKTGLLAGVSIGFRSLEEAFNKETQGYRFLKTEVLELSLVAIPAQPDARIDTIKSLDVGLAVSGTEAPVESTKTLPGVPGSTRVVTMRTERLMKKSYADQIASWEATRQAKAARMDEILSSSGDTGLTLDAAQKEEHDTLETEVKEIDDQLVRLRAAEERAKKAAVEVKGRTAEEGSQTRSIGHVSVERKLEKGILFARYAMCVGVSRGITSEALRLAKEHYPDDPGVYKLIQKAPVAGGSTTGSHYLDDMVPYGVMNDFIEYLRPGSIIGKFGGPNPGGGPNYPGLNRVGFNERVSGMSTGYTAGWKGEGLPALPSAAVTFNMALLFHNMSALAVLTKEAIRFSNPSAEARVRDELARAVNAKLDIDFVDPAKAAVGATSPASITNGVVATAPTGATAAHLRTNLATMIGAFATANLDPADIVLIMSATQALQLSMMVNTLGNNEFPDITMKGGQLRGFPVIVSEHLTAVGSPSTQMIVAVKASDVYLADDGVVTVDASDQASLEMVDSSNQTAIAGTGASLVSLWQTGAVGFLAQREITWKMRRATAVKYISPAAYAA